MSETQRIRRKSFTYRTSLRWAGEKAGILSAEDKPSFRVASPPEFGGEAQVWTPGSLFLAAIETCAMTTFVALAARKGLPLVSFESSAEALLEYADGAYRFTRVAVRPRIVVRDTAAVEDAQRLLHEAHASCMVANSVRAEVVVEGDVRAGTA